MLQITVPLCYAALGAALLRRRVAPPAWLNVLVFVVLAAHVALLALTRAGLAPARLGIGEILSLLGLSVAIAGLVGARHSSNKTTTALALVVAAALSAATGSGAPEPSGTGGLSLPLTAHVILSVLAHGFLAIAALTALAMLVKERQLRAPGHGGAGRALPAAETLESQLFSSLTIGFTLLTLAIFTGLFFVDDLFAQHLAHKTTLTLASWLLFGVLLYGRWRHGWRAKTAVHWTLGGFTFLVLAYFGSRFVLEHVLNRQWG